MAATYGLSRVNSRAPEISIRSPGEIRLPQAMRGSTFSVNSMKL